jgi:hypothetical protein
VTEQTAESYAATFETNVLGVVLSMRHELRVMQAQGNRQHHQPVIDHGPSRRAGGIALHRQQAGRQRPHQFEALSRETFQ